MLDARYRFFINDEEVTNPLNSQELQFLVTFDNDNTQGNISNTTLTFYFDSARLIKDYVNDGINGGVGIFEGLKFNIEIINDLSEVVYIDEYIIDFETYIENEDNSVEISFKRLNGLNFISEKVEAITFSWLESKGLINDSDYTEILYVVQKEFQIEELISLTITTGLLAKMLADSIEETSKAIANATALLATGITGGIASAIFTIANAIIQIAKTIAILIAIKKLIDQILEAYIPIPRTHKTITLRKALEKICEYLEYDLETNLPLENYIYLPSNPNLDVLDDNGFIFKPKGTQKGIPKSGDYGYTLSEMLELIKKLFNCKYTVSNNTLRVYNVDDVYWQDSAEFRFKDEVLIEQKKFNNNELKANKLYSFSTDLLEEWTVKEFKGTNYEVITRPNLINKDKNVLLKGLDRMNFNVALGNKKRRATPLDKIILAFAKFADSITGVFGGSTNYQNRINEIVNCLKVYTNNHTIPKVLYYTNNQIPDNHRDILSAKGIYERYYRNTSFVLNDFYNQKEIYTNIKIPFNYYDFIKVNRNSYIVDYQNSQAKITRLEWSVMSDYAIIDFWVRKKYTENLIEEYVEAG